MRTLSIIILIIYTFYNDNVNNNNNNYIFDLYEHINYHYHFGNNGIVGDPKIIDSPNLNENMRREQIDQGMSVKQILNISFNKFHNLIHLMNNNYNINSLIVQFDIIQIWILFKSLIILTKSTGANTEHIDIKGICADKELDCSLIHNGLEQSFTNILLCSIYSFNANYDWFNDDKFNSFIDKYGSTIKTLSTFVNDREKYNVLYALGSIHALRYTNISLSNNDIIKSDYVKQIDDITVNWLTSSNRAMIFTVRDPKITKKLNYFILEVQDRVLYVSNKENGNNETVDSFVINNQVMNDNNNYIDSFIVYNVMNSNKNNIDYICYDIDELKKLLKDYKNGDRDPFMNRVNQVNVNIDESVKLMKSEVSYSNLVLKIIGFVMLMSIIVFILYSWNHESELKYKTSVFDKSLL